VPQRPGPRTQGDGRVGDRGDPRATGQRQAR
jgi:hypothetical protein